MVNINIAFLIYGTVTPNQLPLEQAVLGFP